MKRVKADKGAGMDREGPADRDMVGAQDDDEYPAKLKNPNEESKADLRYLKEKGMADALKRGHIPSKMGQG